MDPTDSYPTKISLQEEAFNAINPSEFEALGIDLADIPEGTFAALKHPTQLQSRFGGNAYGFGLHEAFDRLPPERLKLVHSIAFDNPGEIGRHYKELNEIYKKVGLLIRYSRFGVPYYLIPVHLLSGTLSHVRSKVNEISKIVGFHRKKYFKEHHNIGLITQKDDLITRELSLRFKDHRFVVLNSLETLQTLRETLDLVIVPRDLYEIILMENFGFVSHGLPAKRRLDQYAIYILWKIYGLLKPDGEIFIISDYYSPKTSQTTTVTFKTEEEEKRFILFSHIFKTRKKYHPQKHSLDVNIFDFQKYLGGHYVEQDVLDRLLQGRRLKDLSVDQVHALPYLNYRLPDSPFLNNQEKSWSSLLSIFFDRIFLKPLIPDSIKADWQRRFSLADYSPHHMLIYLGQKKPLKTTLSDVRQDVTDSSLVGCPPELLAEHRDSFAYVIRTLRVVDRIRKGEHRKIPQVYLDRLKQPLEQKSRRFPALNDVVRLISKIKRLERIAAYLNPDNVEGNRTSILKNLEILTFFGFTYGELKEILFILLGHTALGRIISGKMNEKALKPVSDLARTYEPHLGLNLLRYCRLMTVAETEAARESELTEEQLSELFALHESTERVVTNRDIDWDSLLDEAISSMGGIHNKIVRKLLKMINHFEFLDNWAELGGKGPMEKESLADYDEERLSRIENVIRLVKTIDRFEEMYLKLDPLQLPAFYRKFLEIEFHGTGHLFERMDSELVFILLWITVNVARGEVINFNPILGGRGTYGVDEWVRKVEQEARLINTRYLDLSVLKRFGDELYQGGSSFIIGTGFQLRVVPGRQAVEVLYMDMTKDIDKLDSLTRHLAGTPISRIPVETLKDLDLLFSRLESFYQSHLRLISRKDPDLRLPARHYRWFRRIQELRKELKSNFLGVLFRPADIYTDLSLLSLHGPSLLAFVLPEFTELKGLDTSTHLYLKSPVIEYIMTAARKLQALIRREKEDFQDASFLHALAQREFGPMATGIVGFSESQVKDLEEIVARLKHNRALFDALVMALVFQDLGRLQRLREKYGEEINPADLSQAGALFIDRENIAERYRLDSRGKRYLTFFVRYHGLLHHIIRGEMCLSTIREILAPADPDLIDAFFVFSLIMISAIREDLILEDMAGRMLELREMCHRILSGKTTLDTWMNGMFIRRGRLYQALERYRENGLPDGMSPSDYLEAQNSHSPKEKDDLASGRMLFAMERLFRLKGIRYVEFTDILNLIMKVPLKFIYKRRAFSSIGYATFEKEIYEAFRIYNTLQNLAEDTRHFILDQLSGDRLRVFGYEKVSRYLNYENQLKLLLVAILGAARLETKKDLPVCLNFLTMSARIEDRYEAINHDLSGRSIQKLWEDVSQVDNMFTAESGIVLKVENFPNVLTIDFRDRFHVSRRISHMEGINDVEQLKNYFHYSLQSLKKYPFYTDDYELRLEQAYENRLRKITDAILAQAKKQMDLISDFEELHNLVEDLLDRSLQIGFSKDQKHRLNDLYELRKDSLKRDKLSEIDAILKNIKDMNELKDHWEGIKWYLQRNRRFFGKAFECLIATKFDEARKTVSNAPRRP